VYGYWVVVGSLVAGVGTLYLMGQLWGYRDLPGARWFLAAMSAQAVWCFGYGLALLAFDPVLRRAMEAIVLAAIPWTAICYLGFSLGYTGRAQLLDTWWFRLPLALAAATSLVVFTNPFHGLIWAEFSVVDAGGVAGATYTHEPGLFVFAGLGTLWVTLGTALLFDTVVSYGPLFRGEAAAVGLSPLVPGVSLLLWLFEVGPTAVNLTPVMFIPHVVLDSYAFIESDMFEFLPGTRRAGERTALEDLGAPVFIVDTEGRVVTLNAAARRLVDASESDVLTRSLSDVLGADVDLTVDEQRRTVTTDGERREYLVTPAPLDDRAGTHVGYTLVFQDVTESVRREQRLTVMNRVLRHNLRNDLNVVQGYVEASAEQVENEKISGMLGTAVDKTTELARTGEKVRDIEAAIDESIERKAIDLTPLLKGVIGRLTDTHAGTVETNLAAATVRTDPEVLSLVVENLLENALLHVGDAPEVALSVRTTDAAVEIVVADEGPGIPDHELETIAAGTETDLVHGSGMGLWVVDWGVDRLGGDIAFDTDENGTTVTLTLPRQAE